MCLRMITEKKSLDMHRSYEQNIFKKVRRVEQNFYQKIPQFSWLFGSVRLISFFIDKVFDKKWVLNTFSANKKVDQFFQRLTTNEPLGNCIADKKVIKTH